MSISDAEGNLTEKRPLPEHELPAETERPQGDLFLQGVDSIIGNERAIKLLKLFETDTLPDRGVMSEEEITMSLANL
jgi:hypothetical protein